MLRTLVVSFAVLVPFVGTGSHAAEPVEVAIGQKLDSGLGRLPPYAQWHQHPELRHMAASATPRTAGTDTDDQRDRVAVIRR